MRFHGHTGIPTTPVVPGSGTIPMSGPSIGSRFTASAASWAGSTPTSLPGGGGAARHCTGGPPSGQYAS